MQNMILKGTIHDYTNTWMKKCLVIHLIVGGAKLMYE